MEQMVRESEDSQATDGEPVRLLLQATNTGVTTEERKEKKKSGYGRKEAKIRRGHARDTGYTRKWRRLRR